MDTQFMRLAIDEAGKAAKKGEVPIGAIAVVDNKVIGRAHNIRERTKNPMGHAELLLLEKLSKKLASWRLDETTFYITCEPCIMCMGALLQARVKRIVYGCADPKAGACGSLYDLSNDPRLNHRIKVTKGICAAECGKILSAFFKNLRNV